MVLGFVLWNALLVGAAVPVVTNLRTVQRPGNMLVDITYDLASDDGATVWVGVESSEDGGNSYQRLSGRLTGDFGGEVVPGTNRRIIWTPGAEWLGRSAKVKFRVTARRSIPGMVWIEPGSFLMGSVPGEQGGMADEGPQTRVTLTKGYWMGKHEVTQGEWTAVMGSNPSNFKGEVDLPVENVNWEEAIAYCRKLVTRLPWPV